MAMEVGLRDSTYPNLVTRSATATESGEDVLLVGANVPGGGGLAAKQRCRRRGRDIDGEREVEDGERRRQ